MEQTPLPATQEVEPTGCCPPFDPAPWQEKEFVWDNKPFVADHIISFFHMPLTLGNTVRKNAKKIAKAQADSPEYLMLIDENSKWGADIYLEVTKEVPRVKMTSISGTVMTKVFEGPYKNIGKWAKEMHDYVKYKGKKVDKIYFFYTTCPKCAKAYGKNYIVLYAKVS
jgi:hypothetical protein